MYQVRQIYKHWKGQVLSKNYYSLIGAFILVVLLLILGVYVLDYVEHRSGFAIYDPFIKFFKPDNVSIFIFVINYTLILGVFFFYFNSPKKVVVILLSYSLLLCFRYIVLMMIALEPPSDIIPLHDPIIEFFSGANQSFTKDLFFSGHTAFASLCVMYLKKTIFKIVGIFLTLILGFMLIIQHVHYTIDVIAAPFFAVASYYILNNEYLSSRYPSFR